MYVVEVKRRLCRPVSGQANLIAVVALVGAALVLGLAMLSYFTSTSTLYRSDIELINHLNYESVNQVLRLITIDKKPDQASVWILLKRLDNGNTPFLIAVEVNANYLSCGDVLRYDSSRDSDGILCSGDNDCVQTQPLPAGVDATNIYVLTEQGVVDFLTYARTRGYPVIPPARNNVCVLNVNNYGMSVAVLKLNTQASAQTVRIHLLTVVNNVPYIINTYELKVS